MDTENSTVPYWEEAKIHLCQTDPVLNKIIKNFPGEGLKPRGDLFYTLIRSIAGQQISVKAADSVWRRLMERIGQLSPQHLLSLKPEELQAVGLSRRKVEYIHGIAEQGAQLAAVPWPELQDQEILERLCALRGVGEWTAQMVMIFTLSRPDILPLADIGLLRSVEKNYASKRKLSKEEVESIAQIWRPWRSVATWYLWRDLDPVPVEY